MIRYGYLIVILITLFPSHRETAVYASSGSSPARPEIDWGQARFTNITFKNGLPSNTVNDCIKDKYGFIWFATDNGLCRYDGKSIKVFRHEADDSSSIPENNIQYLCIMSLHELLMVGYDGNVIRYDYRTGRFTNLNKYFPILCEKGITNIYIDQTGIFWLTTRTGLLKTDKSFSFFKEFKIPDQVKGHPFCNQVNSICEDGKGRFWLSMFFRGVMLFDPETGIFSHKDLVKFIPQVQVRKIKYDGSGYVYIGTHGEGIFKVDINNLNYTNYRSAPGGLNSIAGNRVTDLCLFRGYLITATIDGLSVIKLSDNSVETFNHDPDDPSSLINDFIYSLYLDSQAILWISTFGGMSKLYLSNPRFKKHSQKGKTKYSLSSSQVNHFLKDKYNNLWFATTKGVDIRPGKQEVYFHYDISELTHHTNEVVNIYQDTEENIWLGTWGGGLVRTRIPVGFKAGDKLYLRVFTYDSSDSKTISSNFIRWCTQDKQGNLWISTWNGGMNKILHSDLNHNAVRFQKYFSSVDSTKGLASNYINQFIVDEQDNFWLCTGKGLQKANFSNSKFEMYFGSSDPADPINSSTCIIRSGDGTLWHANYGGLLRLLPQKGEKYRYEIIYNDPNHPIYSVAEDNNGNIWFTTTGSEVGFYNCSQRKLRYFSMSEEVDNFDFYLGAALLDEEDIYFPGRSGYLTFRPGNMAENRQIPSLYITSIKVMGKNLRSDSDITLQRSIEINYDENNILISFAALNFIHSERNEYKYLLEGFDNKWVSLKNNSEINFAGLAPGEYRLRIIGANNDGYWNNEGVHLSIAVLPPFWKSNLFRLAAFLTISLIIYGLISTKLKRLKTEREKQFQFSRQLIGSQETERKRLSQELHDSLGQNLLVVKNWLEMYISSKEKDPEELNNISELVKESIAEVKQISANLHPHQLERLGLNKALISMTKKISASTSIEIINDLDDITNLIPKEHEINIYRIIQEALNNVVKHSKSDRAELSIKTSEKNILISIQDYGDGFDKDDALMHIRFNEGLGLKSLKERARLINAELNIQSKPSDGTIITLSLKRYDHETAANHIHK